MPRVRIDWVDAARGVALTGVVLHHMVQATETDVAVNGGLATFDGVMDGLRMPTLIALSGWGQEEDLRRTQQAGFDHHLIKPADLDRLKTLLTSVDGDRKG